MQRRNDIAFLSAIKNDRLTRITLAAAATGVISLYIPPIYWLIGPTGCFILVPSTVFCFGLGSLTNETERNTHPYKSTTRTGESLETAIHGSAQQ